MDVDLNSKTLIESFLRKVLDKYAITENVRVMTDFYLQPDCHTGELKLLNDDDEILSSLFIAEWIECKRTDFYLMVEHVLNDVLRAMQDSGFFERLKLLKPYSFVLVDGEKEAVSELLLVDDQETLLLHGGLLSGLDEELDAFLADLLSC